MELGAATRIISTERKEVIIDKIKTRCRVVQKLLLELSYWLMLISLGADVDVDLGPRPNQAKLPSFSFYPIHFIHCLNLNGMNWDHMIAIVPSPLHDTCRLSFFSHKTNTLLRNSDWITWTELESVPFHMNSMLERVVVCSYKIAVTLFHLYRAIRPRLHQLTPQSCPFLVPLLHSLYFLQVNALSPVPTSPTPSLHTNVYSSPEPHHRHLARDALLGNCDNIFVGKFSLSASLGNCGQIFCQKVFILCILPVAVMAGWLLHKLIAADKAASHNYS